MKNVDEDGIRAHANLKKYNWIAISLGIFIGVLAVFYIGPEFGNLLAENLGIDVHGPAAGQKNGALFAFSYIVVLIGMFAIPYAATCFLVIRFVRTLQND